MKDTQNSTTEINIERRIRKHIHGRLQTFEIDTPPGFLELCERAALKMIADFSHPEASSISVQKKNGRIRIQNAPFELSHELLLFGLTFSDIKILLYRGRCSSSDKLNLILESIDWSLWLPTKKLLNIDLRVDSNRSHLYNEGRIKERVKALMNAKLRISEDDSGLHVGLDFRLERESLEIFLSLGGRDFWQRGHKKQLRHAAPLREDIAACLIHRLQELNTQWAQPQPTLVLNPFCGTGTLLHETALYWGKAGRTFSEFDAWTYLHLPFCKTASFQHRVRKTLELCAGKLDSEEPTFFIGEDKELDLTRAAQSWFEESNLKSVLKFQTEAHCCDSTSTQNQELLSKHKSIWLLANPPFGLRLSTGAQGGTDNIYRQFAKRILETGKMISTSQKLMSGVVLCPNEETWTIFKKVLSGWQQRCEHFTLGGLDIRAFYFSNAQKARES